LKSSSSKIGLSQQQNITGFFKPTATTDKLPRNHPKQKRLTRLLVGLIAVDGLPISIVEKSFFRQLLFEAEPR